MLLHCLIGIVSPSRKKSLHPWSLNFALTPVLLKSQVLHSLCPIPLLMASHLQWYCWAPVALCVTVPTALPPHPQLHLTERSSQETHCTFSSRRRMVIYLKYRRNVRKVNLQLPQMPSLSWWEWIWRTRSLLWLATLANSRRRFCSCRRLGWSAGRQRD